MGRGQHQQTERRGHIFSPLYGAHPLRGRRKVRRRSICRSRSQPDGSTITEYLDGAGKFHRPDGPAYLNVDRDGNSLREEHWFDGKLHNEDGPAVSAWRADGSMAREEYWQRGKLHNEEGPAVVTITGDGMKTEEWWIDGRMRRLGGQPTRVETAPNGSIRMEHLNGDGSELHREDGPAVIEVNADGSVRKHWWQNGQRHRPDDLPTKVTVNADLTSLEEYVDGRGTLHRAGGPAYRELGRNGKPIVEEHWENGRLLRVEDGA